MSSIWITDNHELIALDAESNNRYKHDFATADELEVVKKDIEIIANKTIGTQCEDNPNMLVFPQALGYHSDDIDKGVVVGLSDNKISTNNIMGFIGVNNTQIDIKSRFANADEDDYFLHYMLQKVFSINLFDIKHTTRQEDIFDFLLYLFPHFLKKALAQGVFKKYRRFEYNDANIRGPIDVNRHIRENIPFRGTVAYSTREHSYDNEVTQLVRHTIEFIRTKEHGAIILNNDPETKSCITQITLATQSYNVREHVKVINQNLRPIRHPYYSAYTALQKICLQILRRESFKYGQEKDKVYGVLFDGAWLWEEYLNKIFIEHKLDIIHAENRTGKNGIQLYEGSNKYFPDFYRKTKDDNAGSLSFVLDAKYKRLGKNSAIDEQNGTNNVSICRDDLFQMITYMHVLPAKHCALVYPLERKEPSYNTVFKAVPRKLMGFGGNITGFGIPIPEILPEHNYSDFCESLKSVELSLKGEVKKITFNENNPN